MNRPLLGLLLGALLGAFDGSTAFLTAAEKSTAELMQIVMWSSMKGLLAGVITGWVVRRTGSIAKGITVGFLVAVALAVLVSWSAVEYDGEDPSVYWKIVLPGAVTGLVVGYATVRYGKQGQPREG